MKLTQQNLTDINIKYCSEAIQTHFKFNQQF